MRVRVRVRVQFEFHYQCKVVLHENIFYNG